MIGNLTKILIFTIIVSLCKSNAEGNAFQYKETGSDKFIAQLVSKQVEEISESPESSKLVELVNNLNKRLNSLDEKLAIIQNEVEASNTPSKALIISDDKTYSLVEVNETAKAYNQIVKRKPFVEVTVSWENTLSCERTDRSAVTLDGREVWSGTGRETSATFKVYHGDRYQIQVHKCNGKKFSHSDPTEIVVADTDGKHLIPPQTNHVKNYYVPTSGKVVAGTYYEKNMNSHPNDKFTARNLPIHNMTHLLYEYIEICGAEDIGIPKSRVCEPEDDFKVYVNSTEPALISSNISNQNHYNGSFGQMMMLKKEKPDLKILVTIGAVGNPFVILDDEIKRDVFASSVKEFLRTWKFFDGVDIAWIDIDPNDEADDDLMENIMKKLRQTLDELSQERNKTYILTISIPARQEMLTINDYGRITKLVDNVFVLNYMLKGPWSNGGFGHQNALYAPAWNPNENQTVDSAIRLIIKQGVSREKIVIGTTLYGTGWTGVKNYSDDNPFTGYSEKPYKDGFLIPEGLREELAQGKWEHGYDEVAEAAYLFRKDTGDLVSYDDSRSTRAKAKYVNDNNLGGLHLIGDCVGIPVGSVGYADIILDAMNTGLGNKLYLK